MKKRCYATFIILSFALASNAQITDYKCPKAITIDSFHCDSLARVHPLLQDVFAYLKTVQLSELALGRYPIVGDQAYVIIVEGMAKSKKTAKLEAHDVYWDIQIPLLGEPCFGLSDRSTCVCIKTPYSVEKDIVFYEDSARQFVSVKPGEMILFGPGDAHATDIGIGKIRKAVVKVKL